MELTIAEFPKHFSAVQLQNGVMFQNFSSDFFNRFGRISRGLCLSLLNGRPEIYGENSKQAEKVENNRSARSGVPMSERQRNYPDINHLAAADGECPAALAAAT